MRSFFLCALLVGANSLITPSRAGSPPDWIWPTEDRRSGQSATLHCTFDIDRPVVSARLKMAADFCRARLSINSRPLLIADAYGPWVEVHIEDRLRIGENSLVIAAESLSASPAVALSIDGKLSGGQRFQVATGSHFKSALDEQAARSPAAFGKVGSRLWGSGVDGASISAFDDYTQWKQALGADPADPSTFRVADGFQIDLVRAAQPKEGSWISLEFDDRGRLLIGREDRGIFRAALSFDGSAVEQLEMVDDQLRECRGLLWAHDSLYVNANNSKAMYRLRDTDGDGAFDETRLLRKFPGKVGHGRNDLTLGPDGMIYSIHGDAVDVPAEDIIDYTSPFRDARRGAKTREGHLVRTDPEGKHWELLAAGLRNPFGVALDSQGDIFTYDADAEFDMGSPWYRPTRVVQLLLGADYGWRGVTGSWPPYFPDRPDNAPAVVSIGKGSPTSVKFGQGENFPPAYRKALFILDWAYGRVVAVHLAPRGAGHLARAETFLQGRPLNVTDLAFADDGSMYLVTGGRKTRSAIYRVRHVGQRTGAGEADTPQQQARRRHSRSAGKALRRLQSEMLQPSGDAVDLAIEHLDDHDPLIAHGARLLLERQPIELWAGRAVTLTRGETALPALLALARADRKKDAARIVRRLAEMTYTDLDVAQRKIFLHILMLCDEQGRKTAPKAWRSAIRQVSEAFPSRLPQAHLPPGLGGPIDPLASQFLLERGVDSAVNKTIRLLAGSRSQHDRLHYLFALRNAESGWTIDDRRVFFKALNDASALPGGAGMPGFLSTIRSEAAATLTDDEKKKLGHLIEPSAEDAVEPSPSRPFVKKWRAEELISLLGDIQKDRDHLRGRRLFSEAACSRCHRVGSTGSAVGPDLSSVSNRFSPADIVRSIVEPSAVVAEKYRNVEVVTVDGRVIVGKVVPNVDYRSPNFTIAVDPLRSDKVVEIAKSEIEERRESPVSPMPQGLLDTLNPDEALDLLAFLLSGGEDRDSAVSN